MNSVYDEMSEGWSPLLGIPGPQRQATSKREVSVSNWDREDNSPEVSTGVAQLRIDTPDLYDCPYHGHTDKTITFTVDDETTTFCMVCFVEKLRRDFTPLERIRNE